MLKAEILNLCIWIFLWSSNWSIQLFIRHFHLSLRIQDACFTFPNYSHCVLGNGFFLLSVRYVVTSGKLSHISFTDICEVVLPLRNKRGSDWRLSCGEVSSLLKEEGGKENVFFFFFNQVSINLLSEQGWLLLEPFKFSYKRNLSTQLIPKRKDIVISGTRW